LVYGLLINWKYPHAKVSIQTEIHAGQSTDLNYKDIKGLNYAKLLLITATSMWERSLSITLEGFYIGAGTVC
jgi:hypothetical protein